MTIEEMIKKLFGEIEPLGDQHYDDIRCENLHDYEVIFNYITRQLLICADYKNDNRYSVSYIGERAYKILKDNFEQVQDELRIIDEQEV